MKRSLLFSAIAALILTACGPNRVSSDQLKDNEGTLVLKESNTPFTGIAYSEFEEGKPEMEGTYKEGKPSGPITHYWPSGGERSRLVYNADGIHLNTTTWYESGEKESSIQFTDGASAVTEWHENGALKTKANYNADHELEGAFESWYETGNQKETGTYAANLPQAGQQTFHPNGNEASKLSETENGLLLTKWNESGQLVEETTMKDGKKNGPSKRWHENGQLAEEGHYTDGLQNGDFQFWLPNGELLKATTYVNGEETAVTGDSEDTE